MFGAKLAGVMLSLLICFQARALLPSEIYLPNDLSKKLKSFEPSAALYLKDLNLFLIGSDDTTKKDEPLLFLMSEDGEVQKSPIQVKGLKKMTDIESISEDEQGWLYLLGSQGLNKHGKDLQERNLFVRASRDGKKIKAEEVVELRPMLLDALEHSKDPVLKSLKGSFVEGLDIESHFVREGRLYLGFKNPQPSGGIALIVDAGPLDQVFENSKMDLKVWKKIDFNTVSGEQDLLSEMHPYNGHLILTTTQEEGPGRLWSYDEESGSLSMLQEFTYLRPEGLAIQPDQEALMVVFDQNLDEAFFAFGPLTGNQSKK